MQFSDTVPTELVTTHTVYGDMLDHPFTDHAKKVFLDEWIDRHESGLSAGVPVEQRDR